MNTSTLIVSEKGNKIEPVPEGIHNAVCVGLYHVGTQHCNFFETDQRKLIITWELPELLPIESERYGKRHQSPRCLSRNFTLSLNEKANLRQILESWRGRKFTDSELKGFDIGKLLGVPCQLQVEHEQGKEGRTFAKVTNVLPAPRDSKVTASIQPKMFSVTDLKEAKLPDFLPEWVKNVVMQSREWEMLLKRASNISPANELDCDDTDPDEVPF